MHMSKIQLDDMVSPEEQLPLSIQYVEKDRIPIRFWTLFIHLPSLNREVGLLKDFGHKHAGWGATNGRIWWMTEMMSPPAHLLTLMGEFLNPNGLIRYYDYVLLEEQNINPNLPVNSPLLNKPVAGTEAVPWLESRVDASGEQWVWWKKIEYIPF